eukprot:TRINITY_DN43002_c0_g1_i1.p1 TRINITY_DN43002_c0_g1~~TRINITY_DN43002_c0_g1_i1.p1  ORF type:complete len:123 (-),score=6.02 TRINITY_DN43002_c0_g1_i1:116-484(-)
MTGSDVYKTYWLHETLNPTAIDLSDLYEANGKEGVVLLNHLSFGYYRVLYDNYHYEKLAEAIKRDKEQIPILTRLSIICDAYDFYTHGLRKKEEVESLINAWNGEFSDEEQLAVNLCAVDLE